MAAIALNTAGIKFMYCVEATAGTRPAVNFTEIPNVTSIPAFAADINTLQATPLSAEKNHFYIPGLADPGGSFALTVNDTDAFRTVWDACVTAYAGLADGKRMWFEIAIPDMTKSFYFPGQPMPLGFGGADVDAVLQNTANIIPEGDYEWATASTTSP